MLHLPTFAQRKLSISGHPRPARHSRARQVVSVTIATTAAAAGLAGLVSQASNAADPNATYEVATIPDTNFAIPAGALYVANGGSDSNPGSLAAPFATIHKAVSVAPTGGTIVVRGGTYRESIGGIRKKLTLQAYPHESPWVKGSVVASTLTAGAGGWSMPFTPLCGNCYPSGAYNPAAPAAGLPEQVFVDSAPVTQAVTKAAMGPNSFFVDRSANKLWLNDDPTGHTVEVTTLASALTIGGSAAGTAIKGIGFAHWGTVYQGGMNVAIMVSAPNVTFDSDTFAWASSRALGVYGANDVVTNSRFLNNGMNGVTAHMVGGFDFENNEVAFSNYEQWSITPSPFAQIAGVKITHATNTVIRGNDFHDNSANGLWFDQVSADQTIVSNQVLHNTGHGIAVEVSGHTILAGNVVAGNGRDGLKLSGANDVEVWNNTVVDNGWAQIGVYEDPRHTTGAATSDTTNVRIGNNIFQAGPNSTKYVFYSMDISKPKHFTTLQMVSVDDHNNFGRTNAAALKFLFSTQASLTTTGHYLTLADYNKASGREHASTNTDGVSLNAMFADPANDNYTLSSSVANAMTAPATLPGAVAAALGGPATPTHVGALDTGQPTGPPPPPPDPTTTTTSAPPCTT